MNRVLYFMVFLVLFFGCAPQIPQQHFDKGVALFEQGEYYNAINEFSKYPPRHKLYNDAQDYVANAQEKLDQVTLELFEKASLRWKDDYYSEALSIYFNIQKINPEADNIDEIITKAEIDLENAIKDLQKQFEESRRENDIFACKQSLDKMLRISPEHPSVISTRENYQALKDVILQKSYMLVEDYIKSGRRANIEKAALQLEYMQGIDENDQRTVLIARKLDEYLERERQRSERSRERQQQEKLQEYMRAGSEKYEQGLLKEAIEIWEKARREGIADNTLNQWLNKARKELSELVYNYVRQGEFYFEMEDYSKAKELFEKALDLDPNNASAKDFLQKIIIIQQ